MRISDWSSDVCSSDLLHATISTRRYHVAVPEHPFHLDALLTDCPLTGGLAPMLGDAHLRVVSVRRFPTSTWPGLLDDLNRLGRSEERRVGKEWVRTGRSRGWPDP